MPPKPRHHAVTIALMLHLQHHALIRLISPRRSLRHHPIQPRTLKPLEPIHSHPMIPSRRRHMNRSTAAAKHLLHLRRRSSNAPPADPHPPHKADRRTPSKPESPPPATSPAKPPDEAATAAHQNPAHPSSQSQSRHPERTAPAVAPAGLNHLRKIPIQRLPITALNQHLIPITKHQTPKPIPLRLKDPLVTSRNLRHPFRKHRQYRRTQRQTHTRIIARIFNSVITTETHHPSP